MTGANGEYFPLILADMENRPDKSVSAMAILTAMLWERFQNGAVPIALVSMDNCSQNGDKLRASVRKTRLFGRGIPCIYQ